MCRKQQPLDKFARFIAKLSNGREIPMLVCREHDDAATKDAAWRIARITAAEEPGPVETIVHHVRWAS